MTDAAITNDLWPDTTTLDNHIEDIHYPPNWLRFDDATEFPNVLV